MTTDAVSPSNSDNCASTLSLAASALAAAGAWTASGSATGALALPNDGSIRDGEVADTYGDAAGAAGVDEKNGSFANAGSIGFCGDDFKYGSGADTDTRGDAAEVSSARLANGERRSRSGARSAGCCETVGCENEAAAD